MSTGSTGTSTCLRAGNRGAHLGGGGGNDRDTHHQWTLSERGQTESVLQGWQSVYTTWNTTWEGKGVTAGHHDWSASGGGGGANGAQVIQRLQLGNAAPVVSNGRCLSFQVLFGAFGALFLSHTK